jgi:3-phenylpropionate/trans-cinnamate dioxygenase ferredoxin reductase component
MKGAKIVIAGGGMVAGYAAKQLVELGLKSGDLAILSADTALPYERPPLSKGFLAGKDSEDSVRINAADFYADHGIEVMLTTAISAVNPDGKRVTLSSGEEFGFEKLILATGSHPRTLGIPGATLANVLYLRSLDNSKTIRKAAETARQAIVIGGGFIGMEVTAVLAQKSVDVTMVLSDDRIWKKFFTPQMSNFFEGYYTARGVRFVKTSGVSELRGDGAVHSAVLKDGRTVPCDLVVAGIGARPVTDMLTGSGVEVGDGVMVNEYLETNRPGILAAGDVANYPDLLFGKRRRVEHWDNAVSQGQYCARALMGERTPFKHVPYFFSDVFDLSYEFWGDAANADEVIHRGDLATSSFSVWWLRQKSLVAAFTMNRPEEERDAAPKWIELKQAISATKLADASEPVSAAADHAR